MDIGARLQHKSFVFRYINKNTSKLKKKKTKKTKALGTEVKKGERFRHQNSTKKETMKNAKKNTHINMLNSALSKTAK